MEHYEVIIIGGGPAGFNAVKTVKTVHPDKKVLLIEARSDVQIPCAIPYVVSGRIPVEKNRYPLSKVKDFGAELLIDRVLSVNASESKLFLESGKILSYDRLIMATGWVPRRLNVDGVNLKGIYYIDTSTEKVREIANVVRKAEKLVIVGGGFIAIGFADLITRNLKKKITVVEATDRIASGAFSKRTLRKMEEDLKSQGVEILKNEKVVGFEGKEKVERVVLSGGKIEADAVFIFIGFLPNSKLAVDCGIETEKGFIKVDSFLRTSVDNVLSAGNCIAHRSVIDGEFIPGMLASVSARDGRIAGLNVSGPEVEDRGIVPAGITEAGGKFYGFAGYTEETLTKKGLKFKEIEVKTLDGYPGAIGAEELELVLYFLENGKLVGAEVEGKTKIVSPLVDLISRLVERGETAQGIAVMNSVAFPPITPSPLLQPIQEGALRFLYN